MSSASQQCSTAKVSNLVPVCLIYASLSNNAPPATWLSVCRGRLSITTFTVKMSHERSISSCHRISWTTRAQAAASPPPLNLASDVFMGRSGTTPTPPPPHYLPLPKLNAKIRYDSGSINPSNTRVSNATHRKITQNTNEKIYQQKKKF